MSKPRTLARRAKRDGTGCLAVQTGDVHSTTEGRMSGGVPADDGGVIACASWHTPQAYGVSPDSRSPGLVRSPAGDAVPTSEVGVWCFDVSSDRLWWSEQSRKILGIDPDIAPTFGSAFRNSDIACRTALNRAYERALRDGRPWSFERSIRTLAGRAIRIRTTGEVDCLGEAAVRVVGSVEEVRIPAPETRPGPGAAVPAEGPTEAPTRDHAAPDDPVLRRTASLMDLGHEIRTPLCSILGYVDVLSCGPRVRRADRRAIEVIRGSALTALAIADGLLDMDRATSGDVVTRQEVFALEQFIDDTVDMIAVLNTSSRVMLRQRIAPDVPRDVAGDAVRLRQILQNLLGNSLKFTDEGHVTLVVERDGGIEGGVRFTVTDTGVGFPEDLAASLFTRFAKAKGADMVERPGTGLGLAISRSLAEAMGGKISAERTDRGETILTLVVPLPERPPRRLSRPPPSASPAEPGEVLLAEDVEIYRDLLSGMLRMHGHSVDIARDGVEVIDRLKAKTYDVVLMDLQLPRLSGIEAARVARSLDGANSSVPIFALTAGEGRKLRNAARGAGMNGVLSKSMEISDILCVVARAVSSKRL